MQKFLLFIVLLVAFTSCKKDNTGMTPIVVKPILIDREVAKYYSTIYSYDSENRILQESGTFGTVTHNTNFTYEPNKYTLKYTDSNKTSDFTRNFLIVNGRIIQKIDPDKNERTEYEYDTNGYLKATMRYDKDNKQITQNNSEIDADGNTVKFSERYLNGSGTNYDEFYEYTSKVLTTIGEKNYGYIYFGKTGKYAPSTMIKKEVNGKVISEKYFTYTVVDGKIIESLDTKTGEKITYTYK